MSKSFDDDKSSKSSKKSFDDIEDDKKSENKEKKEEKENDNKKTDLEEYIKLPDLEKITLKEKRELKKNYQLEINSLKRNNNDFRQKLKRLSNKLTETLEKIKIKNNNSNKPFDLKKNKLDVLKKELENSKKQLVSYEKELFFYKNKLKVSNHIDKIQELEDEIYKGEKEINSLILENRNINKEIFKSNKILKAYKNEADQAITMNYKIEENKSLKIKLRDYMGKDKKFDENIIFQKDLIEKLYERYKEVCTKVGETAVELYTKDGDNLKLNLNNKKNKQEKKEIKMNFKNTIKYIEYGKPEDYEKKEFNEKDFNKIKNKVKILTKTIHSLEKANKVNEMKFINLSKKKEIENKEIEDKISVIDKEIDSYKENINKLREGLKPSVISPLEKYFLEETEFEFSKENSELEKNVVIESLENITFILKNDKELLGIIIKNNKKLIEIGKTKIEDKEINKKEINFNLKYEINILNDQKNFIINNIKFGKDIETEDEKLITKIKGNIKLNDINNIIVKYNQENIVKLIIK